MTRPRHLCELEMQTRLEEFLVAEGVVDDINHEGLRVLLREEDVSSQRVKTWKASCGVSEPATGIDLVF